MHNMWAPGATKASPLTKNSALYGGEKKTKLSPKNIGHRLGHSLGSARLGFASQSVRLA